MYKQRDTADTLLVFVYDRKRYNIIARTENTSSGFRHCVSLANTTAYATINYYNRTWESYGYQTAVIELFEGLLKGATKGKDKKRERAYKALIKKAKNGQYEKPFQW